MTVDKEMFIEFKMILSGVVWEFGDDFGDEVGRIFASDLPLDLPLRLVKINIMFCCIRCVLRYSTTPPPK